MYKTVNTDSFEIDKKNVIMISAVQRKLPFLVLQKDQEEALFADADEPVVMLQESW